MLEIGIKMTKIKITLFVAIIVLFVWAGKSQCKTLSLKGIAVTPHVQSHQIRYRKKTDFSLGARTHLFIQNVSESFLLIKSDTDIRLRGRTPKELLDEDEWAWYDFPDAWKDQTLMLAPKALTVWTWNGKREKWGVGKGTDINIKLSEKNGTATQLQVPIEQPKAWLSVVTFLGTKENPFPDRLVFHVANETKSSLRLESCRLWLPENNATWRVLLPQIWNTNLETFPKDGTIPSNDRGVAIASTGILPLTYTALEVRLRDSRNDPITLWAHLRIKREIFDISGGWVSSRVSGRSTLTFEPYLKTLRRMHINTGHIGEVRGYTDNPELYSRYPLKLFNKLADFKRYDTDSMLKRIHAVEFLGEPQYGGGRPVHPMEVWRKLTPYQSTRLATTVTHSEERIWRFYAGLSDYPHYDAYRVCAPSADSWRLYERWTDERIRWGAPLETIGEMTRSLRELNRPVSIAYWSQGANKWGRYGGRQRTSPTPQELRAQAYHALAARITSLYWFNLSLKSIIAFPDLIEPISIIGREIRLLENYYLEGDAYSYERLMKDDRPDWDVSVIAGPKGAVLFALDINYKPDTTEKVFKFGPPRYATITFPLPLYLRNPAKVLRIDAGDITSIPFELTSKGIRITKEFGDVNVFVAVHNSGAQKELEKRRKELEAFENSFGFDPAQNSADFEQLKAILEN
jgi:hypothetical protein